MKIVMWKIARKDQLVLSNKERKMLQEIREAAKYSPFALTAGILLSSKPVMAKGMVQAALDSPAGAIIATIIACMLGIGGVAMLGKMLEMLLKALKFGSASGHMKLVAEMGMLLIVAFTITQVWDQFSKVVGI